MLSFLKSSKFKKLIAALLCVIIGMGIAAAIGNKESVQSSVLGVVFSPLQKAASYVSDKIGLSYSNATGKTDYINKINEQNEEIEKLRSDLIDYENIKRQNTLYKEFLQLKEENEDYEFVECTITGRDSVDYFYSFTLSKGKLSGISVGDPVIYGKNLVGVVEKAYPSYCVVRTVLDTRFNAAAYEIVTNETGYVTGSTDLAKDGLCKLAALSSDTLTAPGSLVCTSGIGGVFPKDLIIGKMVEIKSEKSDITNYAVIEPAVEIKDLSDVFVLTAFDNQNEVTPDD